MKAIERREAIVVSLTKSSQAISASQLAKELNVSRQIIVGDVALLRAEGMDILATPRGYIIPKASIEERFIGQIACQHTEKEMREELYTIVDYGGEIVNVIVEHALYGELIGQLTIRSRSEVDDFFVKMSENQALPLSHLTNGIHLHTIACKDKKIFLKIKAELTKLGILYQNE